MARDRRRRAVVDAVLGVLLRTVPPGRRDRGGVPAVHHGLGGRLDEQRRVAGRIDDRGRRRGGDEERKGREREKSDLGERKRQRVV